MLQWLPWNFLIQDISGSGALMKLSQNWTIITLYSWLNNASDQFSEIKCLNAIFWRWTVKHYSPFFRSLEVKTSNNRIIFIVLWYGQMNPKTALKSPQRMLLLWTISNLRSSMWPRQLMSWINRLTWARNGSVTWNFPQRQQIYTSYNTEQSM